MALDGGSLLALALGGRLFIEFTGAELREKAGLFNGALEATKSDFKRFVFFNANGRHQNLDYCFITRKNQTPVLWFRGKSRGRTRRRLMRDPLVEGKPTFGSREAGHFDTSGRKLQTEVRFFCTLARQNA